MTRLFLALVLLTLPASVAAQDLPADTLGVASAPDTTSASLALLVLPTDEGVVLRWAPGTAEGWLRGTRDGYHVDRITPDGVTRLTRTALRPWSLDVWRARADPDNRHAAVAAQVLWGEEATVAADASLAGAYDAVLAQRNRHALALFAADLDAVTAEGLALRLLDPDGQPGDGYRVIAASDTAYALADDGRADLLAAPPSALIADAGDGQIGLSWSGAGFTAFHVARAQGDGPFRRLTAQPLVPSITEFNPQGRGVFVDTTAANGVAYVYRVSGLSPFATTSAPAEVEATPLDRTPPPPPVLTGAASAPDGLDLRWTYPDAPADLVGFRVGLLTDLGQPPVYDDRLLPPNARADRLRAELAQAVYVVVAAVDQAGNAAPSTPRLVPSADSTGPAAPSILTAEADENGVIRLAWARGDEPDLAGYRIYRVGGTRALLTGALVRDTTFEVPFDVRTLDPEATFEVVALDLRRNPSTPSLATVSLPDAVPPVAPVLLGATPEAGGAALSWVPSPSADVVAHIVLARPTSDAPWAEVSRVSAVDSAAVVALDGPAQVAVAAEDAAGLRGLSALADVRPSPASLAVTGLEAEAADGRVRLSWAPVPGAARYLVYRTSGDVWARHAVVEVSRFEEASLPGVRYAVEAIGTDGRSGYRSESVEAAP